MKPTVTVLIPCFNAKDFITETIDSVLQQSYKDYRIIVQDDCSTDGTWNLLVKNFGSHPLITLVQNDRNLGMCANWNKLFDLADGEYWLKLDADDIIYPDFLKKTVERALKSNADFVGSSYLFYDNAKLTTSKVWIHERIPDGKISNTLEQIFVYYPLHLCFTLLRGDFVKKISPDRRYFMETEVGDAEFQIRAALTPGFVANFINEELGLYRFHGNNSSLTPLKQSKSFFYDVVKKHHKTLKSELGGIYSRKIQQNLIIYIKEILKAKAPIDMRLLYTMIRYATV